MMAVGRRLSLGWPSPFERLLGDSSDGIRHAKYQRYTRMLGLPHFKLPRQSEVATC